MAKEGAKQLIFLVLVVVVITIVFILLQNTDLIVDNILPIAILLIVLFLIVRYDFVLQLKDYERAVIFTLGKVNRVGGPGWAVLFPPFESGEVVDLRTKTIDIPRQNIVTKDNVEVNIDAVVYLKIGKDNASVINSVVEISDYIQASKQYVIGLIRDKAGSLTLTELISSIEELNKSLRTDLDRLASKWGVQVEEAAIKDIQIPKTVIQAMHEQKASVQRKLARMEGAKAHQAEIEAVKAAAEQLSDKALSYYYIKALEKLGEGKSTKFIFPMELTKLAQKLSSDELSETQVQKLLEKYLPLIKDLAKKK
ncbi:MAG TPA: SPFH domain-containing protein [archaeon]|nr:SPFH domain-containing protein [archaeon]